MIFKKVIFILILCTSIFSQENSKSHYIMRSLLVPGWGNSQLNSKNSAFVHFTAEAVSWAGFFYYSNKSDELRKDYKNYAKRNLGLDGKYSKAYYKRLSIYKSYDNYIEFQQRQGVDINDVKFDIEAWRWESDEAQGKYSDLRKESIETDRLPAFFVYAMIFNRLVSIFTTSYDYNQIQSDMTLSEKSISVDISYSF